MCCAPQHFLRLPRCRFQHQLDQMPGVGQLAGAYILLFLSNTLSSSAGVGGGLLNVAILHSVLGEGIKEAVVLSLAAIFGNTLVQVVINLQARHPGDGKKSVIYWDMIAMMLPAELGGSNLGVILSEAVPSTILYIGAIIVLMVGGIFSAKKASHLYELETARNNGDKNDLGMEDDTTAKLIGNNFPENSDSKNLLSPLFVEEVGEVLERSHSQASARNSSVDFSLSAILDTSAALPPLELPWTIIRVIAGVWLLFLGLYIAMSFVPGCSLGWGLILMSIYLVLLVEIPSAFSYLIKQQNNLLHTPTPGEVTWNTSTFSIPVVTFCIGLLTALLGFGGGEIIGPYLLHLRIQPLVSTSTSGMISFLNTGLSLIHYGILGKVHYAQSAGVFAVGMCAALCGRLFSLWFVAKYDRASILVCALVAVLAVSWVVYIFYIATDKLSFEVEQLCQ